MKILVVDDSAVNRLMLNRMLCRMQHEVVLAENGEDAIQQYLSDSPDLILMDILMPRMNGLEAIKAIRELSPGKWTPIFVLSALSDTQNVIESLHVGADDYLSKPFHPEILSAKIASVQRAISMQAKILCDAEILRAYHAENEQEHQFLQDIFERLIKQNDLKDDDLQFWLNPAQRFSGDLLCARRINPQQIYFMLADATGHGLTAALPTVLANQVFQGMSKKSLPVGDIAREMNRVIKNQLPTGRFIAMIVGLIDSGARTVEIWNGGLPEAWVLDQRGLPIHSFKSCHTFAGVLGNTDFDDRCEKWQWQTACELFMYSDGVTDAQNADQQVFGSGRLHQALLGSAVGERVSKVREALSTHLEHLEPQDDISCLAIRCP